MEKAVAPPAEPNAYGAPGLVYAAERLIIRSGNISMAVKDTRAVHATIEAMVERMAADGAFVVSAEEHGGAEGSQPYISMSIRIPAIRFRHSAQEKANPVAWGARYDAIDERIDPIKPSAASDSLALDDRMALENAIEMPVSLSEYCLPEPIFAQA